MSHEHKPRNYPFVPHNMPQAKTRTDLGWLCSLCGLSSVQRAETSYIKHLEDLHGDQLEEQQTAGGYKEWRETLINLAFKPTAYKYGSK